jgi:hypothetical protein
VNTSRLGTGLRVLSDPEPLKPELIAELGEHNRHARP